MIVPVLWVSRHEDILARGYADQGLFEAILDRSVWSPPDAITFQHYELDEDSAGDIIGDMEQDGAGALVVLPARHHVSSGDVAWVKRLLARLPWYVLLLSGDEEWVFPWRAFPQSETARVWAMQPRPEHIEAGLTGFPGGWYPGTHDGVEGFVQVATPETAHKRYPTWMQVPGPGEHKMPWFFAGQVTHSRRQECVEVLRDLPHQTLVNQDVGFIEPVVMLEAHRAVLHETEGYLQGIDQPLYWSLLADAKVIPCPSGPMTVDTARAFEALEAGCVPVLDEFTPDGRDDDYWHLLFGDEADKYLPLIRVWPMFPEVLQRELEWWPRNANFCFSLWQRAKRRWAKQLDSDLRAVSGQQSTSTDPNDLITAIIPTSPTPGDPSTDNIATTVESIRAHLPTAEIVIVADGVRPEQEHQRADYEEYVRRLLWRCNFEWSNVVPIVMDEWGHQANAVRKGLEHVDTPLLLFVEHDTPLDEHPIDWDGCCHMLRHDAGPSRSTRSSSDVKLIRFHHEKVMLDDHRDVMVDRHPLAYSNGKPGGQLPLWRTSAFWARPHLTTTAYYREKVMPYFGRESRTMIEDCLYSPVRAAYQDRGEAGWAEWGLAIYAPSEPHMQRSTHLDSRGDQPKWDMVYAYDGIRPTGAPWVTGHAPEDA